MAIAVGNSGKGLSNGTLSVSASLTTQSGDNFIIAAFGRWGTGLVKSTGVSFDGDAFTKIIAADGTERTTIELWYLVNPSITTANVTASYATGSDHWMVVLALSGVNTSSPIRGYETAAIKTTGISDTIASAVGDLVVDGCTINATTGAPTQDAGQTLVDTAGRSSGVSVSGGMSYEFGAASNTLGWSWSGTVDSCLALVSIKPSVGGIAGVKTINGIASADIKTVNGIAVADIKSIQGLT